MITPPTTSNSSPPPAGQGSLLSPAGDGDRNFTATFDHVTLELIWAHKLIDDGNQRTLSQVSDMLGTEAATASHINPPNTPDASALPTASTSLISLKRPRLLRNSAGHKRARLDDDVPQQQHPLHSNPTHLVGSAAG
ncbi:hypothetical protein H4218_004721, partial [Coemansia sp. IMI 209128]